MAATPMARITMLIFPPSYSLVEYGTPVVPLFLDVNLYTPPVCAFSTPFRILSRA
jgi:hypothetical protein